MNSINKYVLTKVSHTTSPEPWASSDTKITPYIEKRSILDSKLWVPATIIVLSITISLCTYFIQ